MFDFDSITSAMIIASIMLYTFYMWALIASTVIVFGLTLLLTLPLARKGPLYKLIVHGWGKTIVAGSGVKVTIVGRDKLDPAVPYVFMSNHQSYFDVICLVARLTHPVRFVAKKELLYVPVFGLCMWASGHIIINRAQHAAAVGELKKAAAKIRAGTPVLVFPEGTRSPDHKLGPFKKGGFMLALEAQVPVVPLSIVGSHPMMPKDRYTFARSDVTIVVGDPIPTAGLNSSSEGDKEQLMALTRKAMVRNFPVNTPEYEANRDGLSIPE